MFTFRRFRISVDSLLNFHCPPAMYMDTTTQEALDGFSLRLILAYNKQTVEYFQLSFLQDTKRPLSLETYEGGSKSFRTDQLFQVTEIKQLCYFSI